MLRRPQKTPPTDPIDTLLDPPPSERVTLPDVPQALVKQRLRDALQCVSASDRFVFGHQFTNTAGRAALVAASTVRTYIAISLYCYIVIL